ncbi:ferredoxin [Methanonatronarchaeum sp. AMET6-2]|uniref:ferredoxin n=1 Tax=Methanonatronarchaeum sp. AMET6-2 TaxID=2933293 RepID=UPI0011FAB564|nr:ferredoxin [Methanonatronarchaeum sp. AMET6-2]RZN62040.1 MAG: ferredoxin [Methanonatronarchaeia archaeon]UOY10363.1 ferredoxin [Methanonatronarchaeum sp. AMET6-2]
MKVVVDQDACIACGICSDICDEVFEENELDLSQIVEEYRNEEANVGEVDDDIECVEFAVEDCPVSAIEIK